MGFQGQYGFEIRVTSRRRRGPSPVRIVMFLGLLVVAVAFLVARGCMNGAPRRPKPVPAPPTIVRTDATSRPSIMPATVDSPSMPEQPLERAEARRAVPGAASGALIDKTDRPADVRALLDRLSEADRKGDVALQIDTLERLRSRRDAVADIDDMLARRLGNLNRKMYQEGTSGSWFVPYTVRAGDTVQKIAREHGATLAAVLMLNNITDARKLRLGSTLRVPNHPSVKLKVHVASQMADLEVNGRFFRRYDVVVPKDAELGERVVTRKEGEGPTGLLKASKVRLSEADLKEVALMLPVDGKIVLLNP